MAESGKQRNIESSIRDEISPNKTEASTCNDQPRLQEFESEAEDSSQEQSDWNQMQMDFKLEQNLGEGNRDHFETQEPVFSPASFLEGLFEEGEEEVIDEMESQLPPPAPDSVCASFATSGFYGFNITQTGQSHLAKGLGVQDASGLRVVKNKIVLAAIADGVGSCPYSDWGAWIAVQKSLDMLEDYFCLALEQKDFVFDHPDEMGKLLRQMMQQTLAAVDQKAEELQVLPYSMHCTLTTAVYDGQALYFAHAGDDGIVAFLADGKYQMVTVRHKGEEASSVYPLQNPKTWQFGKVEQTAGFVMATDGVLDFFVRPEFENNRIYFPFLRPILFANVKEPEQAQELYDQMAAFLASERFRKSVTDDLTLLAVVNEEKMAAIPSPDFDREQWIAQSKAYRQKADAILYPQLYRSNSQNMGESRKKEPVLPTEQTTLSRKIQKNMQAIVSRLGKKYSASMGEENLEQEKPDGENPKLEK